MNDYLSKVRLNELKCSGCNKELAKGGWCLFTDYTYVKYCLDCAINRLNVAIKHYKGLIKDNRRLSRKIIKNKDKYEKYNMACGLVK